MTSKFSRPAVIAALAIGVSGLVAVPAEASFQGGTGLVNQPIATGVSGITPESAVISGAVDTGGYDQPNDNVSSSSAATAGGYSVPVTPGSTWDGGVSGTGFPISATTSSITIDGIPTTTPDASGNPVPTYSGVWVEYDPLSDYEAAGNAPGPETQIAPEEDVNTSTAPYTAIPPIQIGGYPASAADNNGAQPLTPGTTYVYWLEQQTGETTAATTINEFNPVDLYNFLDQTIPSGSGAEAGTPANGGNTPKTIFGAAGDGTTTDPFVPASSATTLTWNSSFTNQSDVAAWQAGTGIYGANSLGAASTGLFAGKVGYTDALGTSQTLNLTSLANPDYQCAPDYDLVSGGPFAVSTAGQPWTSYTATGTISGGISGFSNGSLTYASAQPQEQGSCVLFLGSSANQNFFVTSATGTFTTLPLGKISFGKKANVSGNRAALTVYNKSALDARGVIELTAKVSKHKTVVVAKGSYRVAAHGTSVMTLKITGAGETELGKGLTTFPLVLTSNTDQPTTIKRIKL